VGHRGLCGPIRDCRGQILARIVRWLAVRLSNAAILPECVLAGAGVIAWVLMQRVQPMNDVVWQFWIARQLLGGVRLYSQIWEVNPPLWFWSAVPVEWLAERTGIAWSSLLTAVVVALGAGSAWLTGRLMDLPRQRDRIGLVLLVFVMTTVLPMPGAGQREQLALVAAVPYAALIARRHAGTATSWWLAAVVGLLGAYGFALKHYFALVPVVLEVWLALRLRRGWRPWRPEVVVLAASATLYALSIAAFAPGFITVMLPMVRAAYYTSQASMFFVLVKPYVLFWAVAGGFLLLVRDAPQRDASAGMAAFFHALLLSAGCFAAGYMIQRRGWDYHSIAASGVLAIALGLQLRRLTRPLPVLMGALLLGWVVVSLYPVRPRPEAFGNYIDRLRPGEAVFAGSSDAGLVWPAPDRRKLVWVSRAYSLWMLPAIGNAETVGPNPPQLRQLARQVLTATSQDIRCNPPMLILMQRTQGAHRSAFQDFLFRDEPLRRFVAAHYAELPATPVALAYVRRGPVPGLAAPQCRTIG